MLGALDTVVGVLGFIAAAAVVWISYNQRQQQAEQHRQQLGQQKSQFESQLDQQRQQLEEQKSQFERQLEQQGQQLEQQRQHRQQEAEEHGKELEQQKSQFESQLEQQKQQLEQQKIKAEREEAATYLRAIAQALDLMVGEFRAGNIPYESGTNFKELLRDEAYDMRLRPYLNDEVTKDLPRLQDLREKADEVDDHYDEALEEQGKAWIGRRTNKRIEQPLDKELLSEYLQDMERMVGRLHAQATKLASAP